MSTQIIRNRKYLEPYKISSFEEFVIWSSMPKSEQVKLGIENQTQFAALHNVRPATLTAWKSRPDYRTRVRDLRDKWGFERTGHIIEAIYRTAMKGNPMSQLLWMQYFEGFSTKQNEQPKGASEKVEIGINHITFIIDGLPEPLKSKHHANIRELIEDVQQLRHSGQLEEHVFTERGPEENVPDEANNDAQNVSITRANEMAACYSECVCKDMERSVSTYHHQSAARWW